MARAVVLLFTVGVAIYALVDLLRSRPDEIRMVPKLAWVAGIVLFPLGGALAYLVFGRVGAGADKGLGASGPRTIAPDDDPDFLRKLDQDKRRWQRPAPDDPDDGDNPLP